MHRTTTKVAGVVGILAAGWHPAVCEERRRRIVGNYENRLRAFSSPERLFEYFSSVRFDEQFFLTQNDFARLITPYAFRPSSSSSDSENNQELGSRNPKYNPSLMFTRKTASTEQKQHYQNFVSEFLSKAKQTVPNNTDLLEKLHQLQEDLNIDEQSHLEVLHELNITNREFEKCVELFGGPKVVHSVFDLVDGDGDGLISYAEFMFFNTILTISDRQFEIAFKMFDKDGNGEIDQNEFKQVFENMRMKTPAGRQDRSLSRKETPLFQHLFKNKHTISFEDFAKFRCDLKEEVLRIQFKQYDVDDSKELSCREFGMFLVSHANQSEIDKFVERVDNLNIMKGSISEEEFINFNFFLDYLDKMRIAMELVMEKDGLNKEQFLRAAKAACYTEKGKKTLTITPLQIDILFQLFDDDGNGMLGVNEFIDVMEKRRTGGRNQRRDVGVIDFVNRVAKCIQEA